jgi:hypothetical protein
MSVVAGDPEHMPFLLVSDVMSTDLVTAREHDTIETSSEADA